MLQRERCSPDHSYPVATIAPEAGPAGSFERPVSFLFARAPASVLMQHETGLPIRDGADERPLH